MYTLVTETSVVAVFCVVHIVLPSLLTLNKLPSSTVIAITCMLMMIPVSVAHQGSTTGAMFNPVALYCLWYLSCPGAHNSTLIDTVTCVGLNGISVNTTNITETVSTLANSSVVGNMNLNELASAAAAKIMMNLTSGSVSDAVNMMSGEFSKLLSSPETSKNIFNEVLNSAISNAVTQELPHVGLQVG